MVGQTMAIQGVLIRQKDGIYRQIDINITADGYYKRPGGKTFREMYRFSKGTRTLVACESIAYKDQVDPVVVFNRLLPVVFNHILLFGDVLLLEKHENVLVPCLMETIHDIIKGTHPLWSVREKFNIEEDHEEDNTMVISEDEESSEDDENEDEEDDEEDDDDDDDDDDDEEDED